MRGFILHILLICTSQASVKHHLEHFVKQDSTENLAEKFVDDLANKLSRHALKAIGYRADLIPSFACQAGSISSVHRRLPDVERSNFASTRAAAATSIRSDLLASIGNKPNDILDEEAMLAKSTFPIPPDQLIGLAKAFTAAQEAGTVAGEGGPDWFAPDFRFVAPVVGPFDKELFIDSLKNFDVRTAFPDIKGNSHHFRVCPFEPNRVWFSVKFIGTNTGPVLGQPATGKSVESPVQAHSITFNEKGEVTKYTIGYVLDKETGNTGGLGGIFGWFYAIGRGLPFPEAQPYQPSPLYGAGMSVNRAIQDLFKANPDFKNLFFKTASTLGGTKS